SMSLAESREKAFVVPLRRVRAVGDADNEPADGVDEGVGRISVDRLFQIVGRLVITLRGPALRDRGFRRVHLVADFHGERGNARANEAVLIAADETIGVRL